MASIAQTPSPNSRSLLQERLAERRLPRLGVLAMTPARAVYAYLAQFLAIGLFALLGQADPYRASLGWWTVWGTLIDIACIVSLTLLVRREGIRLRDVVGTSRAQSRRDLLLVLPFAIALLVPAAVIGTIVQQLFYPGETFAPQIAVMHLPPWALAYSIIIWPVIWSFMEEVTYLGYVLPRLEVLTGRTVWAAVLVLLFWTLQHPPLPLILDEKYPAYRAITAFVTVFIQTMLFVRFRRLLPLIITHYVADLSPGIIALLLVH